MCVHHWLIDPPEGKASEGTCRKCGATDMFPNTIPLEILDRLQSKNNHIFPHFPGPDKVESELRCIYTTLKLEGML